MKIAINQSTIKRILGSTFCPKRYKHEILIRSFFKYSEAMHHGHYFEYLALGSLPREGLKLLNTKGKQKLPKVSQVRIEQQAQGFWDHLKKHKIEILSISDWDEVAINENIWLHREEDAYGLMDGKKTIIDLKFSQNMYSDFGYYNWTDFETKFDKIQAYTYMGLRYLKYGEKCDFVYLVFDCTPDMNKGVFHVPFDQEKVDEAMNKVVEASERWVKMAYSGYKAEPSYEQCSTCKVENCLSKVDRAVEVQKERSPIVSGKVSEVQEMIISNDVLDGVNF